jgi:cell wall-associated NlpC family hydrolase
LIGGRRHAPAVLVALVAALLGASPAEAAPAVAAKQAEAQRVVAQLHQIDGQLEHAIEAYNLANERLAATERELDVNRRHLVIARRNLGAARRTLSQRLVTLYTSGESNSTLAVLLGAASLDDLVSRLDAATRVSEQDARVLKQVISFRTEVKRRGARLKRARIEQKRLVAERAAQKSSIERQLAERRRFLASVRDEIAHLQAAERARQAVLARQAQVRLTQAPVPTLGSGELITDEASASAPIAAPPARYGGVVGIAMQYLGIPYKYGGSSPSTGFDCSGFVMYVYAQVGVSLPHNAAAQYGYGTPVSRSQLQPGDLVFFNGLGHNGIYIGGGQFIHSPHTGDVVKISSISGWYSSTWVGARRL